MINALNQNGFIGYRIANSVTLCKTLFKIGTNNLL